MSASAIQKDQNSDLARWQPDTFSVPQRAPVPDSLPTAEKVEKIYQQATEEGYQAGYTQGLTAAREHGERMAHLLGNLQQELSALDQTVAQDLLQLALTVANQVLTVALEVKPELIVPLLREAIQGIAGGNVPASLALNPKDAELVREIMAEHLQHGAVRILEDKSLGRGGCRLHSAGSTIDASVETRWKRVVEAIGADRAWLP
jgi:flagellar assembly protein FliH